MEIVAHTHRESLGDIKYQLYYIVGLLIFIPNIGLAFAAVLKHSRFWPPTDVKPM
jgi:hypothetical protein